MDRQKAILFRSFFWKNLQSFVALDVYDPYKVHGKPTSIQMLASDFLLTEYVNPCDLPENVKDFT